MILQNAFVAFSYLLATAVAVPNGYYRINTPYYTGSYTYGLPTSVAQAPVYSAAAPAASSAVASEQAAATFLSGFNGNTDLKALLGPLSDDSATLIKAGAPRLSQAGAKLNELAEQLPETLANIDPSTRGDIAKVNGIIADICAKAVDETRPTSYTKNATPEGISAMCDYIAKIGNDILSGLDNPSIFQKYTADLNKAIIALNGKAAEITL